VEGNEVTNATMLQGLLVDSQRSRRAPLEAVFVITVVLAPIVGCDSSAVPVRGNVTLNGEPLADGEITFRPAIGNEEGLPAQFEIVAGQYNSSRSELVSGLVPGKYTVSITAQRKTGRKVPVEEGASELVDQYEQFLPPRYNDQTELSVDITGDSGSVDFALVLPPGP